MWYHADSFFMRDTRTDPSGQVRTSAYFCVAPLNYKSNNKSFPIFFSCNLRKLALTEAAFLKRKANFALISLSHVWTLRPFWRSHRLTNDKLVDGQWTCNRRREKKEIKKKRKTR